MNQELKQRFIGAVVVTALAAIFIPMLFDDPVDNSGQLEATAKVTKPLAKVAVVKVTKPLPKEATAKATMLLTKVTLTKNTKLSADEKITTTDKNDSVTQYYRYPTTPN